MSGVTGFATGMIAGALWLVFFIGLGLTARNSPGHPFKSIRRFRSTGRSLELDVPTALKNKTPETQASDVRVVNTQSQVRDPNPRSEPLHERAPRQFQRPTLRPVPNLAEPTLQIDTVSFFEPETPQIRPRTRPEPVEMGDWLLQPAHVTAPHLLSAVESGDPDRPRSNGYGGLRPSPNVKMRASGPPPEPPIGPARPGSSRPSGPPATPERTFAPAGPPAPSAGSAQPEPASKQGRFGNKDRKIQKAKAKPVASTPAPAAPPTPAAAAAPSQKKKDKEKRGMFKIPPKGKEEPKGPVPTRPPVPSRPATPPKSRFTAPYNYIPPGSAPPVARPTYPTNSPAAGSRKWQPPASFTPPVSPSFGNWGPKPQDPEPAPAPESDSGAAEVSEPFVAAPEPAAGGHSNGHRFGDDHVVEAGPWLLDLNANGNGLVQPRKDPELPAFIELSMFQDPTAADDIAAEDQGDAEEPESDVAAGWMAEEAWPSARSRNQEVWQSDEPAVEQTRLMEDPWLQTGGRRLEPQQVEDWTSSEAPWPGESRRPTERTWAEEPESREAPAARRHPEDPWTQVPRQPAVDPSAESERGHSSGDWVEDPFPAPRRESGLGGRFRRSKRAAAGRPEEPSPEERLHRAPPPAEELPLSDPRGQEPPLQPPAGVRRQEGWAPQQAAGRVRPVERDPQWATDPRLAHQAAGRVRPVERDPQWATDPRLQAQPAAPAPPAPEARVEEQWKPRRIELFVDEEDSETDRIAEAAARLKAAKNAIKVENGLAFVLVDDEGRPVLK
jgi:hypothetical protein